MTVSLRVMSVGDGYKYLLKSVAAGDGNRAMATPLTMYYAETGCPPGRWIGSGLEALGSEAVQPGNVVTEAQLERLIGLGIHPVTADALGAAYIVPAARPAGSAGRVGSAHSGASG
ncbi:MAG: relaxase domain-containing protein, partial [Bifidobacteriaceae bacterium]|nr:relaxase domain-containing protein [Bifidobacteriaceae bacterium]